MKRVVSILVLAFLGSLAFGQPSYFVKADMVRGAEGAQGAVCVPNSVFVPGEKIVFRAVVVDATTGEELSFEEGQERGLTATVNVEGQEPVAMFWPPAEEGGPEGTSFFRGPWAIPSDFPTGMYGWTISVTDAEGNTADFSPIGASFGAGSITIQAAN